MLNKGEKSQLSVELEGFTSNAEETESINVEFVGKWIRMEGFITEEDIGEREKSKMFFVEREVVEIEGQLAGFVSVQW